MQLPARTTLVLKVILLEQGMAESSRAPPFSFMRAISASGAYLESDRHGR